MNNIDIDKYNDINYLSGLLFDVLYNKKMDRKVSIETVSISDISVDNIKKTQNSNDYKKLINNIFNRNISFIEKNNLKYIFKINDIDRSCDIVLSVIPNDSNNIYNIENMNKIITYLLSSLVINKETKHILMNIINIDVLSNDIIRYIEKYTDNDNILKVLNKKNNKISIEIREHFFKMDSLYNILNDKNTEINDRMIRVIIFQVLHTLFIIQNKYPKFRHNNLNLKNIYCYLKEKNSNTYEYKIDGNVFIIPNIGLELKITNFDESVVDEIDNESIIDSLKTNDNKYDILTFLNSLTKVSGLSENMMNEIKKIINVNKLSKSTIKSFINEYYDDFKRKDNLSEVSYS
jgi:hypothetical protein